MSKLDKSSKLHDLNNINEINNIIKKTGLDVLVVSYGGSLSNTLVRLLEKNGYKCKNALWSKILCHCPSYININIPVIYIYDNPIKAFLSQKKRGKGYWNVNQKKLNNNRNIKLSDENLLKSMINQFNSWTNIKRDNVLVIKSVELFQHKTLNKFKKILGKNLSNFPIKYKIPSVTQDDITKFKSTKLFEKYKLKIKEIIDF